MAEKAALEATKKFGPQSKEARLAWDTYEEVAAADNSIATRVTLDEDCNVSVYVPRYSTVRYNSCPKVEKSAKKQCTKRDFLKCSEAIHETNAVKYVKNSTNKMLYSIALLVRSTKFCGKIRVYVRHVGFFSIEFVCRR